jgi:hypothetical protein
LQSPRSPKKRLARLETRLRENVGALTVCFESGLHHSQTAAADGLAAPLTQDRGDALDPNEAPRIRKNRATTSPTNAIPFAVVRIFASCLRGL